MAPVDLNFLMNRVEKLSNRIDTKPEFRWATVATASPLTIHIDGDPAPLLGSPSSIPAGLLPGDRVRVEMQNRRVVIHGVAGGAKSGRLLWQGAQYMNANQVASLSELVSAQQTGIVLVWKAYTSGAIVNRDIVHVFVPKWHVATSEGAGIQSRMSPTVAAADFAKYTYVFDDRITGYAANGLSPATSHVLAAVLGV